MMMGSPSLHWNGWRMRIKHLFLLATSINNYGVAFKHVHHLHTHSCVHASITWLHGIHCWVAAFVLHAKACNQTTIRAGELPTWMARMDGQILPFPSCSCCWSWTDCWPLQLSGFNLCSIFVRLLSMNGNLHFQKVDVWLTMVQMSTIEQSPNISLLSSFFLCASIHPSIVHCCCFLLLHLLSPFFFLFGLCPSRSGFDGVWVLKQHRNDGATQIIPSPTPGLVRV